MVLLSSPRLWNFSHPPRGGALERMRVLWAYWPRRMVALPGQQKGKVEIMFANLSPLVVMLFLRLGIAFSVPGYWSSVSTKTMLGLAAGASGYRPGYRPGYRCAREDQRDQYNQRHRSQR